MGPIKAVCERVTSGLSLPIACLWEDTTVLRAADLSRLPPHAGLALRGYLCELGDDLDGAAAVYAELAQGASGAIRDWCRVRQAAVGGPSLDGPGRGETIAALEIIEHHHETRWPWLAVEAAWTAGRLRRDGAAVGPSGMGALGRARADLQRAYDRAVEQICPTACPGVSLERALVGGIWIDLVSTVLKRARAFPTGRDLTSAITLFRSHRRDNDMRTQAAERDAAPVAADTLRIELICAPEEPLVIVATSVSARRQGFSKTTVRELSDALYRYQSVLYALDRQHPAKDLEWLVAVNQAVLRVRPVLERLLLAAPVAWNDGTTGSLGALLVDARRIEIIGHATTALAPWTLLRARPDRCLGEVAAITFPPTDLDHSATPTADVACVETEMNDHETAAALLQRLGQGSLAWLRGHGQFAFGNPLASMLAPLLPGLESRITLRDILDASATAPLAAVSSLFVSVCEAAETHRRSPSFDFLSFAYSLLVAGARTVIAPTMTITDASDRLIRDAISELQRRKDCDTAGAWQSTIAPHLAAWRDDRDVGAAWRAGEMTPVDLAAFIVLCTAG